MIADQVQTQLECLYGIGLEQRVGDYLINKNEAISYINTPAQTTIPKELFLVRRSEKQDTVEVALFLDRTLMENLSAHNPFESINDQNFSDFCIMIEGVSHFVYYLWKAQQKRNITQLEMELQAEIDKFLMLYFFLRSDKNPVYVQQLFRALFDDFHLMDKLTEEQMGRYSTASSLASRYCYNLQKTFQEKQDLTEFIQEIRLFYHLGQQQKLERISL